jgi:5-methylcytosine-specific restriction enzyme A
VRRAQTGDVYSTSRWRNFRRKYLTANPRCSVCGAVATDVDHLIRLTKDTVHLAFDESCVRPLCHRCHSRHTARQVGFGGIGR